MWESETERATGHETLPARIGKYEVVGLLGRGGMGSVYEARHPELGTRAAIKVLDVLPGSGLERELRERFLREARIAARISHPGIVRVHDVDSERDGLYMVMDLVDGAPLARVLAKGPLPWRRALEVARDVALALEAAHAEGVIHRDVKPGNILLDRQERVLVTDFGIARFMQTAQELTRSGDVIGTPAYMAPELLSEPVEDVDGRADVYSLGVVLYEMLTGVSPFGAPSVMESIRKASTCEPPPPSRLAPDTPREVDRLVAAAMERDRARRPRDMAAFRREIEARLGEGPALPAGPRRRFRARAAAVGAFALLAALASFLALGSGPAGDPRPEDELASALAAKRAGRFGEAHRISRAACGAGSTAARRERLVTWFYHQMLLPALLVEVPWVRAVEAGEPAGWAAELGASAGSPEEARFYEACSLLARKEYEEASLRFQRASIGGDDPDLEVLLSLALALSGARDGARVAVERGVARASSYGPLLAAASLLDADRPLAERIGPFLGRASPDAPEWFLAAAAADADDWELERARANLVAAGRAGAPDRAALWEAAIALRLEALLAPGRGIEDEDAARLLAALDRDGDARDPAVRATRSLLFLALGREAGAGETVLGLPPDRELGLVGEWGRSIASVSPDRDAILGVVLLRIGRFDSGRRALERWLARPGPGARGRSAAAHEGLAIAILLGPEPLSQPGREEALAHLVEALRGGSLLEELSSWSGSVTHLDREPLSVELALELARRAAERELPERSVIAALAWARLSGLPAKVLASDPTWDHLRGEEEFLELVEEVPNGG